MELVSMLVAASAFAMSYNSASTPKDFDPVEYDQVVSVVVDATRTIHVCNDMKNPLYVQFLNNLNSSTLKLDEYARHKAGKETVYNAVAFIRKLVLEYDYALTPSPQYCLHKLSEVQAGARTIARALGGRHSVDICDYTVESRFVLYKQSYAENRITEAEFSELVADIHKLKEVDKSGCSIENADKLDKALEAVSALSASL